jgi:hypothetical protein
MRSTWRPEGTLTMLTPALPSPDERGKRWLQAKTEQILADNAVALAYPHTEGDPSCYWGIGPETGTTLYLRLAGDPEPKALHFNRALLHDCGAVRYTRQQQAMTIIRRTLKKMGILSD